MPDIMPLSWQSQTAAVNRILPKLSYLSDLFRDGKEWETETIEASYYDRGRKMAPMVRSGAMAVPIEGHTTHFAVVKAPNIRIKRPFTPSELLYKRQPGTSVFVNSADINSAIERHVAIDLQAMMDDIGNRKEWMAAQALRGVITYSVADGEVFTITTPRDSSLSITLGTFWNDADVTAPKPEEDLESAAGLIHGLTGQNPTVGLCGATAAMHLRRVAKAGKFPLDTKGIFQGGVQSSIWGAPRNSSGAFYIGRVNNIDLYQYSTTLTDENGTSQAMIRDKYVELISPGADLHTDYGAIPEVFDGGLKNFVGKVFSKSWEENDPPSRTVLVNTRPLPLVGVPNATASIKVISG